MCRVDWRSGHVSGAVYGATNQELCDLAGQVYCQHMWTNPLHPDLFPNIRKMEAEVWRDPHLVLMVFVILAKYITSVSIDCQRFVNLSLYKFLININLICIFPEKFSGAYCSANWRLNAKTGSGNFYH